MISVLDTTQAQTAQSTAQQNVRQHQLIVPSHLALRRVSRTPKYGVNKADRNRLAADRERLVRRYANLSAAGELAQLRDKLNTSIEGNEDAAEHLSDSQRVPEEPDRHDIKDISPGRLGRLSVMDIHELFNEQRARLDESSPKRAHILDRKNELGKGQFATVYEIDDGGVRRAFKPGRIVRESADKINCKGKDFLAVLGIPLDNPNMLSRSLALSQLNDLFGWDVIPATEVAIANDCDGKNCLGTLQDKADGVEALRDKNDNGIAIYERWIDRADAEFRRLATQLQIIDYVGGYMDRHGKNILAQTDNKGSVVSIKGIDNDTAFGWQAYSEDVAWHMTVVCDKYLRLPTVVDNEMFEKIHAVSGQDLAKMLHALNMSQKEVEAALKRLSLLKKHINSTECRIIGVKEWGTDDVRSRQTIRNSLAAFHAKVDMHA